MPLPCARNELFQLLLDSTSEAIYGVDKGGRFIFCNATFLRLLGYEEESQLLGREAHPLIHHSHPDGSPYPLADCILHNALHENRCVHVDEEVLWRADGTRFPVEYRSHPIQRGEEVIGAVVTFLDITERKRSELETRRILQELDTFVHTVAHDLRTPLTAIVGFTELLQRDFSRQFDEEGRTILATIRSEGDKMAALLADLLSLARVGKLPPPEHPVEVREVVLEIVTVLQSGTEGKIPFLLHSLPRVRIPRTLLAQVFTNLLGNAVRYAGTSEKPIEIGSKRMGSRMRFFVRDHGPGIPKEEQPHLFDAFYRGSTGSPSDGTGIGLAIVQKIARHYGGRAWVEDTLGGGATFWVEFGPTQL